MVRALCPESRLMMTMMIWWFYLHENTAGPKPLKTRPGPSPWLSCCQQAAPKDYKEENPVFLLTRPVFLTTHLTTTGQPFLLETTAQQGGQLSKA